MSASQHTGAPSGAEPPRYQPYFTHDPADLWASLKASRLLHALRPSSVNFWRLVVLVAAAVRYWLITTQYKPMDHIFSDPGRHYDNAKHFLEPGPMGCSNAYFYQLFLFCMLKLTHVLDVAKPTAAQQAPMNMVNGILCVIYPFFWYRFARLVTKRPIHALRFAAILSVLPTHTIMYELFMTESILMPLLGAAFWVSVSAAQRRSAWRFVLAAVLWTCAPLTRSVVLPCGIAVLLYALYHLRRPGDLVRRPVLGMVAAAIMATGFWIGAQHSLRILEYPTTMGDSTWVTVGWAAGTKVYNVTFTKPKHWSYTYGYSSPSFYISPFDPIYDWHTQRSTKTYNFTTNVETHGKDLKETFWKEVRENRKIIPRLIYENLIFLTFGHSWPESGKGDLASKVCLQERWIWAPIIFGAVIGSLVFMIRRRRLYFLPCATLIMTGVLYSSLFVVMEGRYRKPFEPLLVLTFFWMADQRRLSGQVGGGRRGGQGKNALVRAT